MSTFLNKSTLAPAVATAGLIIVMVAAAMPLLHAAVSVSRIVYAVGAALVLVGKVFTPVPEGASLRLKRLYRLDVFCGLFFVAAAVFLFISGGGSTDWLAFTLAGGALQIYTSVMIPRMRSRESK